MNRLTKWMSTLLSRRPLSPIRKPSRKRRLEVECLEDRLVCDNTLGTAINLGAPKRLSSPSTTR